MLSVREKYWRYSLFVLIAGLGLTIFADSGRLAGGRDDLRAAAASDVVLERTAAVAAEPCGVAAARRGDLLLPRSDQPDRLDGRRQNPGRGP